MAVELQIMKRKKNPVVMRIKVEITLHILCYVVIEWQTGLPDRATNRHLKINCEIISTSGINVKLPGNNYVLNF